MWNPDFGWGFGHGLLTIFASLIGVFVWVLCFSVAVAVLFLLVRFLLVGTRAAQLYVAKNEPPRPAAPAVPRAPASPAPKAAPARTDAAPAAAAPASASASAVKPASGAAPRTAAKVTPPKPVTKTPPKTPAARRAAPKKP